MPRPLAAAGAPGFCLAGLNEEQQAAVTALEGPLLIVAGAGTGKTRVLAHRIAYLLDRVPDLTPGRLLALTFSRKAAEEMRERVEALLGAYADELCVSTFHAFCHQVLQDHGIEIGLPRRVRLLDRVEQWLLLRDLLPTLALVHYENRSDPTECIDGLLRFISRAKDELVSPEDYAAYVGHLPTGQAGLTDPTERRRQTEVLQVYERYQRAVQAMGALDFGDLIVETLRLFRDRPTLLAQYQAQFRYLLVDEFQDTNVAQITLLATLAAQHRNLCVVGDDDQAIYRFRGASYASFLLFQERFPEAKAVRLTQNYRSGPRILRTAERLIRGNGDDRYDPQKQLWTARPEGAAVELLVCQDYEHEARVVADRIRALVVAMPPGQRSHRRIAVLYRAHAHREAVVAALRREGIPHLVVGGAAVFDEEVVKDVIACLRVVHDPTDSVSLFRMLSLPSVGVELRDLVRAARAAKQQRRTLHEILGSPRAVAWRPAARQQVKAFLTFLHTLQRLMGRDGLEGLTRRLVEEIGYRPRLYATVDARAQADVASLSRWYRFVHQYLDTHPHQQDLGAFLGYLEACQQVGGETADEPSTAGADGVQLMTVHQAKGLEFDWVFLLSLVQGRFPSRNRPEAVPFPVDLMKERLPAGDFHLQEERRLCYVAMTRARQGLTLMTVERPYHRPSVFVREPLERPEAAADLVRTDVPPPEPLASVVPALSNAAIASTQRGQEIVAMLQALQQVDPADTPVVNAAIERLTTAAKALVGQRPPAQPAGEAMVPPDVLQPAELKLSFSQLDTYRYCPRKYQYAYVYHIPTRPTSQMQFGTNLHACLEVFAQRLMAGQMPSLEDLLTLYDETWRSEGYPDPRLEAKDKAYGRQLLTRYYEVNRQMLRPPLFVEKPFLLRVGGVGVRGFIDRIDAQPDGRVEVVDYKSGKPKTSGDVSDRLQLNIYALACRDVLRLTPSALSFYYLQTNEKLTFPYDEQGLTETERTITETSQQIRAGAFDPTPGYGKCRVCDFRTICPAALT